MANETSRGFGLVEAGSGQEIPLAMQQLWLRGRVMGAGARLLVEHVFRAAGNRPVEAIYSFALPRDAALRQFTIKGERFAVHSELKPTKDAVRAYEDGIAKGSLAALGRQHGDGVVNLTTGNIQPGETVTVMLEILAGVENHDDGFRFRFPFTLAPGYHRRARMMEVSPGVGEVELPEDEFGDVLLPRYHKDASDLHRVGFHLRVDGGTRLSEVASPSHAVRVRVLEHGAQVELSKEADVPDRDLVLDVKRSVIAPEVHCGEAKDGRKHFVAIIPSTAFGKVSAGRRRVAMVLDRSGSMQGLPMQQARKALEACLGALQPVDEFGIVAFDDVAEVFRSSMVKAEKENRDEARRFLSGIDARGGTELSRAIDQAATLLSGGGDLLVITDGQVMGTEAILATARARGVRLHTLGIGSASQDRFLALLARETGGVSRFVTAQERVDLTAVDLFASIGSPAASDVEVSRAFAPRYVFAGTPLVAFGEVNGGDIAVKWPGGSLELKAADEGRHMGETVRLLHGSRLLTDLDCRGETSRLREVSEQYGLASKEMSLVAVVKRASDVPGELPQTIVVPVGMPEDTQFDAYFNQPLQTFAPMAAPAGGAPRARTASFSLKKASMMDRVTALFQSAPKEAMAEAAAPAPPADPLFELAASIEDDGGMPGSSNDARLRRTLLALLYLLAEGHSASSGAFRSHVQRLIGYLRSSPVDAAQKQFVAAVIEAAEKGKARPGKWAALWMQKEVSWKELGS